MHPQHVMQHDAVHHGTAPWQSCDGRGQPDGGSPKPCLTLSRVVPHTASRWIEPLSQLGYVTSPAATPPWAPLAAAIGTPSPLCVKGDVRCRADAYIIWPPMPLPGLHTRRSGNVCLVAGTLGVWPPELDTPAVHAVHHARPEVQHVRPRCQIVQRACTLSSFMDLSR